MGSSKSKQTTVAFSVPELDASADAGMQMDECMAMSVRSMQFQWTDSVCPLSEMTPLFRGPTRQSPATVDLGHGYWISAAKVPVGDQQRFFKPSGSATLSLANIGAVCLNGPQGRLCILKKNVDTRITKAGREPWHVLTKGNGSFEYAGTTWARTATVSFDKSLNAFVYDGTRRWIARGTFSRLSATNPIFNSDGATTRASVGLLTVYDGDDVIAYFSGSMKGPKIVHIAKSADVAALLCFALAACFWWDDNKVAQINFKAAAALYLLGAG